MQPRNHVRRELFKAAFSRVSGHETVTVKTFYGPVNPDGKRAFYETDVLMATDKRPRRVRREAARQIAQIAR